MCRRRCLTACLAISAILSAMVHTASADEIMVGVYYYPWHGPEAHGFGSTLRDRLLPKQGPLLGHYDNSDPAVITAHIEQCIRGNIDFWACSWWGPGSYEDNVIKYQIFQRRPRNLKYAIMYESTGRLGSFSEPDYSRLLPDFQYFDDNYFDNPHYFKIDGRPVVFIYLTRVYFRNRGDAELAALRAAFPDVYIVADDVFGRNYNSTYAAKWDAVTAYDVYGQSLAIYGSTHAALDRLEQILYYAKTAANSVGVGLIPFASPGFNDRAVRSGHTGAPRYFQDNPRFVEGDLFRVMLRDVVVPKLDPLAENILMVTSFNEWHEDTQIEPTAGTAGTTSQDDSSSGDSYTEGDYYTDYGYLFLDILCHETVDFRDADLNEDCLVDFEDFAILAGRWLWTGPAGEIQQDIVPDGTVNLADFAQFADHWITKPH